MGVSLDISGLDFIVDQILEHVKEFLSRESKSAAQIEKRDDGVMFSPDGNIFGKRANYPTHYEKPCDLRIYEVGEDDCFYIRGRDPSVGDFEKSLIRIAVRCKPLDDKSLTRTRSQRGKRVRKAAERQLRYTNLVIVKNWPQNRNYERARDELRLLAGVYLARDGFIDKNEIWKLFEKFVEKYYEKKWKEIGTPFEGFRKYIMRNFAIPISHKALRSYIYFIWRNEEKKHFLERTGDLENLENEPDNRGIMENHYVPFSIKVPTSTKYEWIKSGKITGVKRKGWRYEIPADFEEQIRRLIERKENWRDMAENLSLIKRQKVKTVQRRLQRYRKRGMSIREIAETEGLIDSR